MAPSKTGFALKIFIFIAVVAVPYFIGYIILPKVVPADFFNRSQEVDLVVDKSFYESLRTTEEGASNEECHDDINKIIGEKFVEGLSLVVYRNGQIEPCGQSRSTDGIVSAMHATSEMFDPCPSEYNKYEFESFLTEVFANTLDGDSCHSEESDRRPPGFRGFCDMGRERTPLLWDHDELVPVDDPNRSGETTLPCHFHTREGVRVSSFDQLNHFVKQSKDRCSDDQDDNTCAASNELHLYAVPAGRVYMFAPSFVGEEFDLSHVSTASGLPVKLKVLSVEPRVFDIYNFFDKSESDEIITRALAEKTESHKMKRSTTGSTSNSVFSKRTSDSGFDTDGKIAKKVKERCLKALGFDKYIEGHTDGLQVLRYNLTKAYIPHMDYLDDPTGKAEHNYASAYQGGNRFATILLYMSDLGENDGGETVFAKAWPGGVPVGSLESKKKVVQELRESGALDAFEKGSWEEDMVAQCRTNLAVRPNSARAVLFYSMLPNGQEDKMSLHGGCPVIRGEKWAANLWVWNTIRDDFEGSPKNVNYVQQGPPPPPPPNELHATFTNTGKDPMFAEAELWYDKSQLWGRLGHGDPDLAANTYTGHQWDIKVDGKFVKQWVIGTEKNNRFFI